MKMETYYQKNYAKEQIREQRQPEVSIPLDYKNKLSPEEKKNIQKDIYYTIDLFEKLLYKTKQKSFKRRILPGAV